MNPLYHVSSSPHVRDSRTSASLMMDVCIAMLPASVFGIIRFGFHAFLVLIICVAASVLSEYIWEKLMHKPITINDFSAVVTGMILGLNLPPEVPLWIPALGGVFAIIIVKQLYGGLGQNFMNPALAARCFLLISFAGIMNDLSSAKIGFDAITAATPLSILREGGSVSLSDLFFGNIPGTIGEVNKLALLIGAAYMLLRGVITLRIPVTYVCTTAVFMLIYGGFDFHYMLEQILSGGLIFGAFYMSNDYVTSPITHRGEYVYGCLLGIITGIFRSFGASAEGVSYAIILGNMLVPLIDRFCIPAPFGKEAKRS